MADAARWVTAAEEVLPWRRGGFLEAYSAEREESIDAILESDAVAMAVLKLLEEEDFRGSASELLRRLDDDSLASLETRRSRAWPKAPNQLKSRLTRVGCQLRAKGVEVTSGRDHNGRWTSLRKPGRESSPASPRHERFLQAHRSDGPDLPCGDEGLGGDDAGE
jgi:hypothetical protein